MPPELTEKTKITIAKILAALRNAQGDLHLRGLAKLVNEHPGTVSRIINNYLDFFVETRVMDMFGFRAKLIRLKPGKENTTLKDVLEYVKLKKRIKS